MARGSGRFQRSWLGWLGLMLMSGAYLPAEELTIAPEDYYRDAPFAADCGPAGWRLNAVPADWEAVALDGTWKFKTVPFKKDFANPLDDEGLAGRFFAPETATADWTDIPVPSSWYYDSADPKKRDFVAGKLGWYRRSFAITPAQLAAGRRVVLDFRRVAEQADVWVNGQTAGPRHVGRYDSFQYDVTDLVQAGENLLAVRVYDYVGHQSYWRRNIGGIYHPVRLLILPAALQCHRMQVSTFPTQGTMAIEAELENPTATAITAVLRAEIADARIGTKALSAEFKPVTVAPGRQWLKLGQLPAGALKTWSGEEPQLYDLTLADAAGHGVGRQRFGYREFRAQGEWLYLNGQKFKPRAFTFSLWPDRDILYNRDALQEKLLRHYKSLGINMIRPHSGEGLRDETLYNLCDELGLLIYLDWSGPGENPAYDQKWNNSIRESEPAFAQFIRDYSSHPSICMWSLGNEIYEGHYDLYFSQDLDWLYGRVKELDRQERPVCTSTGRQTWEAMRAKLLKERTDVLDDHQYRGAYCGSWQENIGHIERYAQVAAEYFGRPMPKIDCEYGDPGVCLRYRDVTFKKLWPAFQLDPASEEFKRQYIEFVTSEQAEVGWYIRLKMTFCTPRDYVLDEAECRRLQAEKLVKRVVEIYRRAGTKCIGGHTNSGWEDLVIHTLNPVQCCSASQWGKPSPIDIQQDRWLELPMSFVMKRVYNPTLVSLPPFNQHPRAGSQQQTEVVVTNDLNSAGVFKVVAQLRLEGSPAQTLGELDFGRIEAMEQKSLPLAYVAPQLPATARGRLELFLFQDGRRVGDNLYPLTVAVPDAPSQVAGVAIYDSAERVFRGLTEATTARLLGELGCQADPIADFATLDQYKYLIIGANSFDKTIIDSGQRLNEWVKQGGRLLCCEQSLCGRVPFYPALSVVAGARSTYTPLSVPAHPLFAGLHKEDFDTWTGGELGALYDYALGPINVGLVAVAATSSHNDAKDCVKPVVCDIKCGAGQIIFSQLAVSKCAGADSVARAYAVNLLNYLVRPEESTFALALPEVPLGRSIFVEDKDAFFVDLSRFVNQGFTDDRAGDQAGGWGDFGTGFPEIPFGVNRLQGGVPFKLIDPAGNGGHGCLVLKGQKRDYFPAEVKGIPVGEKLNTLYFLHTSMYAQPGAVLKYRLHYANGETREFAATMERDLPDWWNPSDRDNALVVFRQGQRGLFLSEFVNPLPREPIQTLDIESAGGSVPFVLAITGRKRFSSVVAGVGEQ